jgi:hypothetical protein
MHYMRATVHSDLFQDEWRVPFKELAVHCIAQQGAHNVVSIRFLKSECIKPYLENIRSTPASEAGTLERYL